MGKKQSEAPQGEPEWAAKPKKKKHGCLTALGIVLLVFAVFLIVIIVVSGDSDTESTSGTTISTTASQSGETTEATTEAPPTYDTETKTVGNWEVTLTGVETIEKLSVGLVAYEADEGCKFVKISMSVKNTGSELDYWQGITTTSKIVYGDYSFSSSATLAVDGDLTYASCNPLVTASGFLLFNVPEEVLDSADSLSYTVESGGETVTFVLW